MNNFVFLLKTYAGDSLYVERLLHSFHRFNRDKIQLYLVAPEAELQRFNPFACDTVEIIPEEKVSSELVKDASVLNILPGYINQQIIKLSFWELGLAKNYFCLDSDAYFIRDFFVEDFMHDVSTPYTILAEDKDLCVDPTYYRNYWIGRSKWIDAIKAEIMLSERRSLTCHGLTTLSAKVLASLREKHMLAQGIGYQDLLRIAPLEFSWYSLWLQKDRTIPVEVREPMFKTFHMRYQHQEFLNRGVSLDDLARAYIGVVVNSNFSRSYGLVSYDTSLPYGILGVNLSRATYCIRQFGVRAGRRLRRFRAPRQGKHRN